MLDKSVSELTAMNRLVKSTRELTVMNQLIKKVLQVTDFPEEKKYEGALNFIEIAVTDKIAQCTQEGEAHE